jgi:hypothetical protein
MPVKSQDGQNDEPANRIIAAVFATIRTPRSRPPTLATTAEAGCSLVRVRDGRRGARGQPSLSFPWSENEA